MHASVTIAGRTEEKVLLLAAVDVDRAPLIGATVRPATGRDASEQKLATPITCATTTSTRKNEVGSDRVDEMTATGFADQAFGVD